MKIFIPDKAMSMEEMMPYVKEAIVNLSLEIDTINQKINNIINVTNNTNIINNTEGDESFYKELIDIKGIGKETADDIVSVYSTKESLIKDLKNKKKLPFRNDVIKLLEKKYVK